jgi:hypothetical protein
VKRSEEQWRRNNEIEARTLQLDCDRRVEQAMAEVAYYYQLLAVHKYVPVTQVCLRSVH